MQADEPITPNDVTDPPIPVVQGELVEPAGIPMAVSDAVNVQKLQTTIALTVGRAMELEPSITIADVGRALINSIRGFARTTILEKFEAGNVQGAQINVAAMETLLDEVRDEINSWNIPVPESETTQPCDRCNGNGCCHCLGD
jgi:hypothetical protein